MCVLVQAASNQGFPSEMKGNHLCRTSGHHRCISSSSSLGPVQRTLGSKLFPAVLIIRSVFGFVLRDINNLNFFLKCLAPGFPSLVELFPPGGIQCSAVFGCQTLSRCIWDAVISLPLKNAYRQNKTLRWPLQVELRKV